MGRGAEQSVEKDSRGRIIKWCNGIKLQNQFEALAPPSSDDMAKSESNINLRGALDPHLAQGGALRKFQNSSVKRLAIPHYKAGEILGRRGENVKWIQTHSGARLHVSSTRDVNLIGSPAQIRRAEQLIRDFFLEDTNATFHKTITENSYDTEGFILVDGFKVQLKYYDLYRTITATYGDLRRRSVLDASEMAVVWVISDILSVVQAMSQGSLLNVTVDMLDDWNKKISLAEHFNYNVSWLRDHFDELQAEFDRKIRIDAALAEMSCHSKVKQTDQETIEAMIAYLTSRLETAKASSSVLQPKAEDLLAEATIRKQEVHTLGNPNSNYFESGSKLLSSILSTKIFLFCFLMFVMFMLFSR